MGINKLIKNLQNQLTKGEKKGKASLDRIDDLLGELKQKEKKLERKLDKENNSSERKQLKLELKIVRVQLKKGKAKSGLFSRSGRRIGSKDITLFTRQLATMMSAGVPLVQAFEIVAHIEQRLPALALTGTLLERPQPGLDGGIGRITHVPDGNPGRRGREGRDQLACAR